MFFLLLLFNYANCINKFNYASFGFYCKNLILTVSNNSESNGEVNPSSADKTAPSDNEDSGEDPDPEMEPPKDPNKKKD